jgi:hypothetical protein
VALAALAARLSQLTSLDLHHNAVGDQGAAAIAKVRPVRPHLDPA